MLTLLNRSIRARIAAGLGLILLLALLSAGFTVWQNQRVKYETAEVAASWIPALENLDRMKSALSEHYRLVGDRIAGRDQRTAAEFTQALQALLQRLQQATEVYAATLETYLPGDPRADQERALYRTYQQARDAYFGVAGAALGGLEMAAESEEQRELIVRAFDAQAPEAFAQAAQAMDAIYRFNLDGAIEAARVASDGVRRAERLMLVITAGVLLVGMALIVWLPATVTQPVRQAVEVAQAIAEGRLDVTLRQARQDELGRLLEALERMRAGLAELVAQVRERAQGVATAAVEIEQGNQSLSSRTEAQASALQQTAAGTRELAEAVQRNAQSAQHANEVAQTAIGDARQGREVVERVVRTMGEVEQSSRRIADIIGLIDGIAFQTNILALNAAVEAARAGEAGRGFAVVAGEVRALAQRAGDAARQIRALIETSVQEVTSGTALVHQAGETMGGLVQHVERLASLVGEISAASREQSDGVTQLDASIGQVDQGTQQNAALVEQIAAAATGLREQAEGLVAAVSRFRTAA